MRDLGIDRREPNRVLARFEASAILFDIAPAATFADLAERLADLSDRHDGSLVSVAVKLPS